MDSIGEQFDNVTHELDHSKRRALLWLDGMSVFGFKQANKRAEIGFIRPGHGLVEMRIYQNGCNLVWSTEKKFFPYSTDDIEITINSTQTGKMGLCYSDGQTPPADNEDFRHMPNLATWHDIDQLRDIPDPKNVTLSARLNVQDGVFWTYKRSHGEAIISTQDGEVGRERIGRALGADITCQPDEDLVIEIKVPGVAQNVVVRLDGPHKYEIVVRTKTTPGAGDHFQYVYHVLEAPKGDKRRFTIRFPDPEHDVHTCDESPQEAVPGVAAPLFGEWICETITGGGGG